MEEGAPRFLVMQRPSAPLGVAGLRRTGFDCLVAASCCRLGELW